MGERIYEGLGSPYLHISEIGEKKDTLGGGQSFSSIFPTVNLKKTADIEKGKTCNLHFMSFRKSKSIIGLLV